MICAVYKNSFIHFIHSFIHSFIPHLNERRKRERVVERKKGGGLRGDVRRNVKLQRGMRRELRGNVKLQR